MEIKILKKKSITGTFFITLMLMQIKNDIKKCVKAVSL